MELCWFGGTYFITSKACILSKVIVPGKLLGSITLLTDPDTDMLPPSSLSCQQSLPSDAASPKQVILPEPAIVMSNCDNNEYDNVSVKYLSDSCFIEAIP